MFDDVLKKVHNRIKYNARIEKTFCFFQIPEFIIGVPLYNIEDLKKYIMNSLEKDGFKLIYIDPNWLFITWEKKSSFKKKKKVNKKKEEYKLVDEYKPIGGFTNDYDLSSMKNKMIDLL